MKKLRNLFIVLALVLSHAMCAEVAFAYRGMLCGVEHMGFSAPADVAFLYAIPFGIGIMLCCLLAWVFHRKSKSKNGCA